MSSYVYNSIFLLFLEQVSKNDLASRQFTPISVMYEVSNVVLNKYLSNTTTMSL